MIFTVIAVGAALVLAFIFIDLYIFAKGIAHATPIILHSVARMIKLSPKLTITLVFFIFAIIFIVAFILFFGDKVEKAYSQQYSFMNNGGKNKHSLLKINIIGSLMIVLAEGLTIFALAAKKVATKSTAMLLSNATNQANPFPSLSPRAIYISKVNNSVSFCLKWSIFLFFCLLAYIVWENYSLKHKKAQLKVSTTAKSEKSSSNVN